MTDKFNAGEACISISANFDAIKADLGKLNSLLDSAGKSAMSSFSKGFNSSSSSIKFPEKFFAANDNTFKKHGDKAAQTFKAAFQQRFSIAKISAGKFAKRTSKTLKKELATQTKAAAEDVFGNILSGAFIKSALNTAAEIKVNAEQLGISTTAYQEFAYIAHQSQIGQDKFNAALETGIQNIQRFKRDGTGPAGEALKTLGLHQKIVNGELRTNDQVIGAVLRQLTRIENETDRAAISAQFFGQEGGENLKRALDGGSGSIENMTAKAHDMNQVLREESVIAADSAKAKLDELSRTMKVGLTGAIIEAAPEIEDLTEKLIELTPQLIEWANALTVGLGATANFFGHIADEIERTVNRFKVAIPGGEFIDVKPLPSNKRDIEEEIKRLEDMQLAIHKTAQLAKETEDKPVRTSLKRFIGIGDGIPRDLIQSNLSLSNIGNAKLLQDDIGIDIFRDTYKNLKDDSPALLTAVIRRQQELQSRLNENPLKVSIVPEIQKPPKTKTQLKQTDQSLNKALVDPAAKTQNQLKLTDILGEDAELILNSVEKDIRKAKKILEDARTPIDSYRASLAAIDAVQSSLAGQLLGNDASFSRARLEELNALASSTGDYEQALTELIALSNANKILPEDFAEGFKSISENIPDLQLAGDAIEELTSLRDAGEISPNAFLAAITAIQQSADYQDDLTQKRILDLQAISTQLEAELALAAARKDANATEDLERRIKLLNTEIGLLQNGANIETAGQTAETTVEAQEIAAFQGQVKTAMSGAFRAAMSGNFDEFLRNKLQNAAANMFDRALDSLLDTLFSALENINFGGGEGGGLGGLAGLFAGFFADGGTIQRGQFGIVGEAGPELAYAGSAPVSIVPFKPSRLGGRITGELDGGARVSNSSVVMNIQTPDVQSFRKARAVIEGDMAVAQRRAQRDI